jgi:hypothetical protein
MKMLIITAGQSYGLIPALSLELLFRLAGTPVPARWNSCSGSLELLFRLAGTPVPARWNSCFIDPGFLGSIKHLGSFFVNYSFHHPELLSGPYVGI